MIESFENLPLKDILSYQDKVVVVTGAAGLIGSQLAKDYNKLGANVTLTDINREGLKAVADKLPNENFLAIEADISSADNRKKLLEQTLAKFGRVDVLVNNAAIVEHDFNANPTEGDIRKIFDVNYFGNRQLSELIGHWMIDNKVSGVIAFMLSIHAENPRFVGDYYPAKAALKAYMEEASIKFGRKGIRVFGISPGAVSDEGIDDERVEQFAGDMIDIGRIGNPEEIAINTALLTSSVFSYLHGGIVPLDGGLNPRWVLQQGELQKQLNKS